MKKIGKVSIVAFLIIIVCIATIIKINMPEEEIRSVTSNGIVATVEKVQADYDECVLEVSLRKEDNSIFAQEEEIGQFNIIPNTSSAAVFKERIGLSKDKKVLNYRFRVSSGVNEKIKNVTIYMNDVVSVESDVRVLDKSIYDLYEEYPLQYDDELEVDKVNAYVPLKAIGDFGIIGVGFGDKYDRQVKEGTNKKELLYIRTRLFRPNTGIYSTAKISGLYNELTGEEIHMIQGSTRDITNKEAVDETCVEINEDYYELTYTEKLKHIKPIISYEQKEKTTSGSWELKINIKNQVKQISQKADVVVSQDGGIIL